MRPHPRIPKLTPQNLNGIWAGITLSWNRQGELDEAAYRENLRRLCAAKVHGIYTSGSTGEFYALDEAEFKRMVDLVLEETQPHGIPVQIGCCADATRKVIRLLTYAHDAGAAGAQVVLPYWMELTDAEVVQFFRDIAAAVPDLPLVHYNIPRAKRFLTGSHYQRLQTVAPNLVGVKFTFVGTHFGELQEALDVAPHLSFFVGENVLVTAMQLGARGSYSSMVCVCPAFMQRMFALAEARRWDEAMKMQQKLARFFRECEAAAETFGLGLIDPVFDKGLSVASGFFVGHQRTRAPYLGWTDKGVRQMRAWLQANYPEFVTAD